MFYAHVKHFTHLFHSSHLYFQTYPVNYVNYNSTREHCLNTLLLLTLPPPLPFSNLFTLPPLQTSLPTLSTPDPIGFQECSSAIDKVYRTESIPGLAFLMKKQFYDKYIVNHLCKPCSNRLEVTIWLRPYNYPWFIKIG